MKQGFYAYKRVNTVWFERQTGEHADEDEIFSVKVPYRSPSAMTLDMASRDDSEVFADAISRDVAPIIETVVSSGLEVRHVSKYMRLIHVRGSAGQIISLANDERIIPIFDEPGTEVEPDLGELSFFAAEHHNIDVEYDQPLPTGSYADGIKVAIIERNLFDIQNGLFCGIRDDHIAFSQATLTYEEPPTRCNDNMDCGGCGNCYDMGYPNPMSGHCVKSHPTDSASLVANTRATGPFSAAQAHLYLPNKYDLCDSTDTNSIYDDFLIPQGVRTASATCILCDSFVADIAIRDNDLFIARSAGNGEDAGMACSWSANSLCVGATTMNYSVAGYSNWINPSADPWLGGAVGEPEEGWRAFTDPSLARDYHVIKYYPSISAGSRIRATISWDACPGEIPALVAVPAVDVDLFLLSVDSVVGSHYEGTWVIGSQSVKDNNEGFDYEIPSQGAYAVVAGWPMNDNTGCDGAATESFGYALRVLAP